MVPTRHLASQYSSSSRRPAPSLFSPIMRYRRSWTSLTEKTIIHDFCVLHTAFFKDGLVQPLLWSQSLSLAWKCDRSCGRRGSCSFYHLSHKIYGVARNGKNSDGSSEERSFIRILTGSCRANVSNPFRTFFECSGNLRPSCGGNSPSGRFHIRRQNRSRIRAPEAKSNVIAWSRWSLAVRPARQMCRSGFRRPEVQSGCIETLPGGVPASGSWGSRDRCFNTCTFKQSPNYRRRLRRNSVLLQSLVSLNQLTQKNNSYCFY